MEKYPSFRRKFTLFKIDVLFEKSSQLLKLLSAEKKVGGCLVFVRVVVFFACLGFFVCRMSKVAII